MTETRGTAAGRSPVTSVRDTRSAGRSKIAPPLTANLDALAKGAGRYILATPIGRVREIRDEVLSHPGRYAEIDPRLRAKEVVLGQGERRRRYILCLNGEEADKQRRHRAEILALLEAELASLRTDHPKAACRLLASRRFGPYLSQDDDGRPYLDQAKVRRAGQLDGKFVLTTNDDTLSVADIALGYKGMWVIEVFHKVLKSGCRAEEARLRTAERLVRLIA